MLYPVTGQAPGLTPKACVFAYDISCPRRSSRVRRTLQTWQTGAQYSVFEVMLTHSRRNDLLAELISLCDPAKDSLAAWAPRRGQCVEVSAKKLGIRMTAEGRTPPNRALTISHVLTGAGNYILCYDIRDEHRLRAVAAAVQPNGAAIQRSVYWLRQSLASILTLLQQLCKLTAEDDVIWVYPLAHATDLWRVQNQRSSLLPVNNHVRQRSQ